MVAGGFARKNVATQHARKAAAASGLAHSDIVDGEIDWAFRISNERLRNITGSTSIGKFCELQFLKYTGHISRQANDNV